MQFIRGDKEAIVIIITNSTQSAVNAIFRAEYDPRSIFHVVTDDICQVMAVFDQGFFHTTDQKCTDIRYKSLFQFRQQCKAKSTENHKEWMRLLYDEEGPGKIIYLSPNYKGELDDSDVEYLMNYHEQYSIGRYAAKQPSDNPVKSRMVIYGKQLKLPDVLIPHVIRIEFPDLTEQDFFSILVYLCQAEDAELQNKDFCSALEAEAKWYSVQLAGFQEYTVLTILQALLFAETREEKIQLLLGRSAAADQIMRAEKNRYLRLHGKLDCVPSGNRVVGLEAVHKWLNQHKSNICRSDFTSEEDITKGILLLGLPGTGKSMLAKSCASILGLPLIKLDISSILGGVVGESEHNMAQVLNDLEIAGAPCVLWIDELEKAFSGVGRDIGGGSAVLDRLFGQLLTFMQDVNRTVFMVATANSIDKLPPEFFRPGRFGAVFSLMLPTFQECVEIMRAKIRYHLGLNSVQLARELMNICSGLKKWENGTFEEPSWEQPLRFFTGADIAQLAQEVTIALGLRPGCGQCLDKSDEQIYAAMQSVVTTCRATVDTHIPLTLKRAAETYVKVMEQYAIPANAENAPICLQNYQPDQVKKEAADDCPQCLACP